MLDHQKKQVMVGFTNPIVRACSLISYAKGNLRDHSSQSELTAAYDLIAQLEAELAKVGVGGETLCSD